MSKGSLLKIPLNDKLRILMIDTQLELVETFISEFLELNGISEDTSPNTLHIETHDSDNCVIVVDTSKGRDVIFGVKARISAEGSFVTNYEVFGSYAVESHKYKRTSTLIESFNDGGSTRDSFPTSGEQQNAEGDIANS